MRDPGMTAAWDQVEAATHSQWPKLPVEQRHDLLVGALGALVDADVDPSNDREVTAYLTGLAAGLYLSPDLATRLTMGAIAIRDGLA